MSNKSVFSEVLQVLSQIAAKRSSRLFVVGGAVRDLLIGGAVHEKDLDFVLEGETLEFAQDVSRVLSAREKSSVTFYPKFGTSKIKFEGSRFGVDEIDLAAAREEEYSAPGKLPSVSPATIEEDLRRRDFTINAMAISIEHFSQVLAGAKNPKEVIIDYYNGLEDLSGKTIRVIHPKSFIDDPTRMYRGCRYLSRLNGTFEAETQSFFNEALIGGALKTISRFRIFSEIRKGFGERNPKSCFDCYRSWGLLGESAICIPGPKLEELLLKSGSYEEFITFLLGSMGESQRRELARDLNVSLKKIAKV